jgi:hypothetical protein
LGSLALLVLALSAGAAEPAQRPREIFRLYPGASRYTPPDTEANQQFASSLRPGTKITAYLSNDPYDKVVAFYRGIAREYAPKHKPAQPQLPSGRRLQKTFLILDGAADLLSSKEWVSVQHPFFGAVSVSSGKPQYTDVRELTEIVWTKKEEAKKEEAKKEEAKKEDVRKSDHADSKPAATSQ